MDLRRDVMVCTSHKTFLAFSFVSGRALVDVVDV